MNRYLSSTPDTRLESGGEAHGSVWKLIKRGDPWSKKLKLLKEKSPYRIRYTIIMPCYFVMDGVKQEMGDEFFDDMMNELEQVKALTRANANPSRWNDDGTYDKKPLDPNYVCKYYQKNLKEPFVCPDCGRTISSKSNLSKHRKTNVCKRHQQPPPWDVAVQVIISNGRPPRNKKLLKEKLSICSKWNYDSWNNEGLRFARGLPFEHPIFWCETRIFNHQKKQVFQGVSVEKQISPPCLWHKAGVWLKIWWGIQISDLFCCRRHGRTVVRNPSCQEWMERIDWLGISVFFICLDDLKFSKEHDVTFAKWFFLSLKFQEVSFDPLISSFDLHIIGGSLCGCGLITLDFMPSMRHCFLKV